MHRGKAGSIHTEKVTLARKKNNTMEHLTENIEQKKKKKPNKKLIICLKYNRNKISWQQTFMHLTAKKKGLYRRRDMKGIPAQKLKVGTQ